MRIEKISVKGLFGIFDHVIPLNMDEQMTIIHGPNGFGKTAILKMINGLFNCQYSIFQNIPFLEFELQFDNDNRIRVSKDKERHNKAKKKNQILCEFYENLSSSSPKQFSLTENVKDKERGFPIDILDDVIPEISRVSARTWRYMPTGETLSFNEAVARFADALSIKIKSSGEPEWLELVKSNVRVRLIESQRLLNVARHQSSRYYTETHSMLPTVSAYSEEISQLIQSKLAEYGTTSQSLDRTFPARAIAQHNTTQLTDEKLREQLNELEQTRSRLIEVGLLDKDDNSDFQIQSQNIDESTKSILSVYVDDVEKKLKVFNEIADKIYLLRSIINKKFSYSYKEINFNKEKGFVFKTLYPNSLSNENTLSPTDLSSGEQHELVLLYELLFKVKPNTLVLIDEPELSLHVGWQSKFLEDLQEIIKLADLDILMATHSPDLIQDRWDLTVELKGPEK
ncbi:AAA family ATPase [Oscillatoria sp. FACHB-1406]|uniref:AAA family ATPase n=1 Tax=Oscillatoria sp. FACHB-1406 TaxID=2692846 RepID=UPI00168942DA|nr:AAA family ATPase [Oscillatoria sp. FACHB-1406]MBD2579750.1 AAA family ATPase [Oscillatoria sp. FACHB-1406]